jgi:hypothetical protein
MRGRTARRTALAVALLGVLLVPAGVSTQEPAAGALTL